MDEATGVAAAASGATYMSLYTNGTVPGMGSNAGAGDGAAMKFDKNGNREWTRQIGTIQVDYATGVAVTSSEDVFVIGHTTGEFGGQSNHGLEDRFVVKYDKKGTQKWVRFVSTEGYDDPIAVAVSSSGDVYVGGSTSGTITGATPNPNVGTSDGFVVKFDRNGKQKWVKQFGTTSGDNVTGLGVAANGDVLVGGTTHAQFPGAEPFVRAAQPFIVKLDKNGSTTSSLWAHANANNNSSFDMTVTVLPPS